MKEICKTIAALLYTVEEYRWSETFTALSSQEYSNEKILAREIQKLYGGSGSFNDLVLYKSGTLAIAENDQLHRLRKELFKKVQDELISLILSNKQMKRKSVTLSMRKILFNRVCIGAILLLALCTTNGVFGQKNKLVGEPVYFSYKSGCNVSMKFLQNKTVVFTINGQAKTCAIRQNANSKEYFDLVSAGKVLAIFLYDDGEIIILNQQYQFDCEDAKGITLGLVNSDQKVLAAFQEYSRDRDYIWANIAALNDKAFYLERFKCYQTSVYILDKILLKDPNRVVAWLNLGDSYWGIDKRDQAKKAYTQYVSLMKGQHKDLNKIPQRVYDRIK